MRSSTTPLLMSTIARALLSWIVTQAVSLSVAMYSGSRSCARREPGPLILMLGSSGIDYALVDTSTPLDFALMSYLSTRGRAH